MENDSVPFMRSWLETLPPLDPRPTRIIPRFNGIPDVRAILFDIYGTLLISDSGDVDVAQFKEEAVLKAFEEGHIEIPPDVPPGKVSSRSVELFKSTIQDMHRDAKEGGIPFPEVDIVRVWQELVIRLEREGSAIRLPISDYERCAVVFEMLCNPVYPMPGLGELLTELGRADIHLGLVSNAQFFTPLTLSYFLNGTIAEGEMVRPFDPKLTFYSYRYLRAKPDLYLFELAREQLALFGVTPGQTLYLGNDMLNDIWAASQIGFKTVLFAGDARSLRLRRDRDQVRNLLPDAVITELNQLARLLL